MYYRLKYKFTELVDISLLQNLMEGLYLASNISSGIQDIDGNILVAVGWREICLKYHRVNSETELLCRQCDQYLKEYLKERLANSEPYICYTCANGLIDAAAPIIIDGEHLATIFQGQFFFEEPDIEQFRRQATRYAFNEEEYLKALAKVPIYSKAKLDSIIHFFLQLAGMLAEMGVAKLRLIESKETALQEGAERLKTIIDNTPNVAIQSYDENGKIQFSNKASETMFGYVSEEVVGKNLNQLFSDKEVVNKFLELSKAANETGKPAEAIEWTFTNINGIEKCVYSILFPIHFSEGKKELICMDIDITDKKHFEKEMYRLERLNLVGEMAAGIGHEVRNPMTTVRGFLQILGNKNYNQQDKEYFILMIQELDRANSIITEFLSLAKNKVITLEIKNLNSVISILNPLIEANVFLSDQELKLDLGEIPELLLDEKEIRQLILNLAQNGIEAMSRGGCLTIRTYKKSDEVVLEVQDEGHGISPELVDKIGTPFFSTKDNGTGLGLAVCYSITSRHNAQMSVTSDRRGTIFKICFKL